MIDSKQPGKCGIYVIAGYRFGVKIGITRDAERRIGELQSQIDKAVRLCFGIGGAHKIKLTIEHFEEMDWSRAVKVEKVIRRSLNDYDLGDELFSIGSARATQTVMIAANGFDETAEHRTLTGAAQSGKQWQNSTNWTMLNYGKMPTDLISRVRRLGGGYGSQAKLARDALIAGLADMQQGVAVECGIHRDGKRFGVWIPTSLMNEMKEAVTSPTTIAGFTTWSLSRMCDRIEGMGA